MLRNGTLFSASLVSKSWSWAAFGELYGNLAVAWEHRAAPRLIKSLERHPKLSSMVRSVEVLQAQSEWFFVWLKSDEAKRAWDVARAQWPGIMPFTGAPNEYLRSLAKNSLLRQEMHPWLADTDERREGLDEAARAS